MFRVGALYKELAMQNEDNSVGHYEASGKSRNILTAKS